ncbi:Zinc carboxypeptidase [Ekhidna lutea]|uniref:Zinc carboxypeptidase n=1 Tax=Ekhidna lutea TaxID=447679 RepID=A0A239KAP1_EKHLU|nr:M14 family metallopeptidase [Ekhidna lutea]SNT15467.1 Zinc carboxypeptidase [Ekhidna lutea]
MKILFSTFCLFPLIVLAQIQSPNEFLGYELGEKFSRHHQVVDYYQHLSDRSEKVTLQRYGKTYENRPLLLAFVSSKENLENLETIRLDNLRRAGIESGSPTTNIPIVWLSYNVHGNESSSTEASMATIYELINDSDKKEWLEKAIIVIDPCINPDGRDRYVNFFWQYGSQSYNPDPNALEHNEIWPGGRPNHYLFDLNRDWAWQTQIESKSRIKVYNQWLPQIHVDFHEQGINSPYYFAPAAQPFHELITKFQRDFQAEIGRNHAKYFDANNWFYFTKQFFDLLYPSYGDTYPTYNGAIGMTYEQAGHGMAGLGIIKQEGDTLSLKDRIAHHHTTGLSTIEVAVNNAERLLDNFENFFGDNSNLKYKTFVLKYDGNDDKFNALKAWLDDQGIIYGTANGRLKGYDYSSGRTADFSIATEDLVVTTNQPKATLAHILFEPKTKLVDSVTYDITAWGVPYAYGIQAYASSQSVSISNSSNQVSSLMQAPEKAYAFIAKWNSMDDARFLAALLKADVKVRFTQKPMNYKGETFDRGSLIIAKRDNKKLKSFESKIVELANNYHRDLAVIQTGFMDAGPDIGSSDIRYLEKPKIALLGYEGTSSLAFGATWHFMEQELQYPVTVLGTNYFSRVDLSDYDVLIMQSGWYGSFGEGEMKKIMEWVSAGGKLIAVEGALNKLKDSDYSSLSAYVDDQAKTEGEKKDKERKAAARLVPYEEQEREFIKGFAPGAIYKVKMDDTHPLAFGYGDTYYTLKTGSRKVAYLDGNNVGILTDKEDLMSGFAGQYAKEDMAGTLVFGVENKGRGQIVHIVDNPLFRSFWQNGKLLMVNAMFFVGQ